MKQVIKVKVEVPDRSRPGSFRHVYSNTIEVDDSVSFDYSLVLKALKMMYPFESVFISFQIS